jgi:ubiquinone/menaquinone biosynthesis C-methylase UbiE
MATYSPAATLAGPADPQPLDWAQLQLPDSWADGLDLRRPRHFWQFLKKVLLRRLGKVELPPGLPVNAPIPKYVLLEFHNLPNGNYSKKFARGYSVGFDNAMLGEMRAARRELAAAVAGCKSVLDVGCGAGHSTAAVAHAGVAEVWGLDASPYLLQIAARNYPQLPFVQGLAEQTNFPAGRFDGVSACFLFHEVPPRHAEHALDELARVLRPGGVLAILEPAREQFFGRPLQLIRAFGWRGLYFWGLARLVHEPFVRAWHERDVAAWLQAHGFALVADRTLFPSRLIVATKTG